MLVSILLDMCQTWLEHAQMLKVLHSWNRTLLHQAECSLQDAWAYQTCSVGSSFLVMTLPHAAGNLGTNSIDMVKYFQGFKGVPAIGEGINPATWMLQVRPWWLPC